MFEPRFTRPRAPGLVLFGHRGAPKLRAENTVPSFVAAWQAGADVIELDLRQSADGTPVVLHDATLMRTTDGEGFVSRWSWAALQRLRCKEPTAQAEPARLASLEDVLAALPDAPLNIDLKAIDSHGMASLVATLKKHRGPRNYFGQVIITSASARIQRYIADAFAHRHVMRGLGRRDVIALLVRAHLRLAPAQALSGRALQVPLYVERLGRRVMVPGARVRAYAKSVGSRIDVWHEHQGALIDTPELARLLCQENIDGLFTDDIASLHTQLQSFQGH